MPSWTVLCGGSPMNTLPCSVSWPVSWVVSPLIVRSAPGERDEPGVGVVTGSRLGRLGRGDAGRAVGVVRVALVPEDDVSSDADDALRSEQPVEAWTVPPHTPAARHRPCCAPLGWASCPRCYGPSQYTQPSSGCYRRLGEKGAVTFKPGTHLFLFSPSSRPGPRTSCPVHCPAWSAPVLARAAFTNVRAAALTVVIVGQRYQARRHPSG